MLLSLFFYEYDILNEIIKLISLFLLVYLFHCLLKLMIIFLMGVIIIIVITFFLQFLNAQYLNLC
jgi:hypothetical protein